VSKTSFTPEMGDRICEQISAGNSLRATCELDWAPARRTVFVWLREQPEFRQQYALAQIEGAHAHADDALAIADDGRNDWMANNDPDNPGYRLNAEAVARSRLRVDTRKWMAARMFPTMYGDKVEITGEIRQRDVSDQPLTTEEWEDRYGGGVEAAKRTTESTH
jgi:hypothetical protein